MSYVTRVLWEGEVIGEFDHGEFEHIANAHFSSTVDFYRRSDPIDGGITVQLLNGDDVEYETFVDGD